MAKFFNFSSAVQNVFNNDESVFVEFQSMLNEAAMNNGVVDGRSKKEVNDKIVSMFRQVIGCDEHSDAKEIRRGIRRNQTAVFDIIEEVIEDMLVTGWMNDPFMMKFVEQKNLALGDKNEFYTPDDSMLSVMRVSGNHHDIFSNEIVSV